MKKIGKLMAAGCMLAASSAWSQPQVLDTAVLDVFFDPEGVAAGLSSGDPQTAIDSLVDTNTGLIRDDAGIALNDVLSGILVNQDPAQVQAGVEQLVAGLEQAGAGLQGPFATQLQASLEGIAAGLQAGDPEAVVDAAAGDSLARGIAAEALNDLLNGVVTADPDRGQQGLEDTIGAVVLALNILSGGAIPADALPGLPGAGGGGGAPGLPGLPGGGGGGLPGLDALPVGGLPAGGLPTDSVPLPL